MTETPAINTLAAFIAEVPRGSQPAAGIARAKLAFLDTIACGILGAQSPATRSVLAAAQGWGAGTAPLLGRAETLPPPWAALANGASAHAFDLDDYTLQANDHPSAVLVPAVLAAAAEAGAAVTGADLLDAYLVGLEVIIRLGESVNLGHYNLGWHTTATLGRYGATAAVCRLKRMAAGETAMALALASSLNAGYVSQFGTAAKPLHAGFSAQSGLLASGLAAGGATAYPGALDGRISFQSLMVPGGQARFSENLAKLGRPWGIEEHGLGAKVYPSCAYTHRAVDCAIALHGELGLSDPAQIAAVRVSMPDFYLAILPFGVPETAEEALFSTAHCVALGLATGANRIGDFTEAAIRRPEIRALAGRVTVEGRAPLRPSLNVDPDDPDRVTVTLTDGRTAETAVGVWSGAPGRDLDADGFRHKARDCLAEAGVGDPDAAAARLVEAIDGLDRASTLWSLTAAMAALPEAGRNA
jgi:2-methylcitrate dehydratase PrpD